MNNLKTYVVVSSEYTEDVNESSSLVKGVFQSEKMALECMKKIKDESLKTFENEYVEFESERQIIIKSKDCENYMFEITLTPFKVTL